MHASQPFEKNRIVSVLGISNRKLVRTDYRERPWMCASVLHRTICPIPLAKSMPAKIWCSPSQRNLPHAVVTDCPSCCPWEAGLSYLALPTRWHGHKIMYYGMGRTLSSLSSLHQCTCDARHITNHQRSHLPFALAAPLQACCNKAHCIM